MIILCQVPSLSVANQSYLITWDGQRMRCSCAGFVYRGSCKHVSDQQVCRGWPCPMFQIGSQWLARAQMEPRPQTIRSEAGRLADLVAQIVHGYLDATYVCGVGPHGVPA
jgi:hypothetical protein